MDRIIFHIDVNSAFLSWEAVYRLGHLDATLDLREIASAVGGSTEMRHGIILAKSLPCKAYGVKTGESIMEARQKCPHLEIVPPHYNLYSKCSQAFMDIISKYTPDIEQYSIDEAFMDMTGTGEMWGDPVATAYRIKDEISSRLGFTVNIGVSHNKLLAKMASELKKPDMVHTLFPNEMPTKMWPLPVSELFYVGRASFAKLTKLGIRTIGELAQADPIILRHHMKSHGEVIWGFANGRDFSEIVTAAPPNKGYGNSTTIPYDVDSYESASLVLLSLAETIGMRLRRDEVKIEIVSTGIKYADFTYQSHQATLMVATNITNEIHAAAMRMFKELWDGITPIRHIGIHTSRVKDASDFRQFDFFDIVSPMGGPIKPGFEKLEKADTMADKVRADFGIDAVKRAVFLQKRIHHASGGINREKETVDYGNITVR